MLWKCFYKQRFSISLALIDHHRNIDDEFAKTPGSIFDNFVEKIHVPNQLHFKTLLFKDIIRIFWRMARNSLKIITKWNYIRRNHCVFRQNSSPSELGACVSCKASHLRYLESVQNHLFLLFLYYYAVILWEIMFVDFCNFLMFWNFLIINIGIQTTRNSQSE